MSGLNTFINSSQLPEQLKAYFSSSNSIKKLISEDTLKEVEDLYILYNSLYLFDSSEFSNHTITSIKRCKDVKTFYFYLKKVMDSNLKIRSRDELLNNDREKVSIDKGVLDKVFKESAISFISCVDRVYNKEETIDFTEVYKNMGKLELINELITDDYYIKLLRDGTEVIEKYNNLIQEKSEVADEIKNAKH